MVEATLERLAEAGINLIPAELEKHYIFEREGFIALVERRTNGFGGIGAAGLLTEKGLAPLVWRGDQAWFIAKGLEQVAEAVQVDTLRRFQSDLASALR